jgi:anti-sigma factor RsiW
MNHITGDDLVAYALDEVEAGTRAATAAHLEACAACRAAHAEIVATLSLAARLEVPARGEHYGAEVWARIEGRLDRGAEGPRGTEVPPPHRSRAWMLPWLAAAAVTLIAVGAYWLGRHSVAPPTVVETVEERAAPERGAIRERVGSSSWSTQTPAPASTSLPNRPGRAICWRPIACIGRRPAARTRRHSRRYSTTSSPSCWKLLTAPRG